VERPRFGTARHVRVSCSFARLEADSRDKAAPHDAAECMCALFICLPPRVQVRPGGEEHDRQSVSTTPVSKVLPTKYVLRA
jgi:hypothetical protein